MGVTSKGQCQYSVDTVIIFGLHNSKILPDQLNELSSAPSENCISAPSENCIM